VGRSASKDGSTVGVELSLTGTTPPAYEAGPNSMGLAHADGSSMLPASSLIPFLGNRGGGTEDQNSVMNFNPRGRSRTVKEQVRESWSAP
jgi:hypothetical protein